MPLIGFALSLPSPLRSAVAGEFSPLDLSPTLWLDASDATTITESGGAVSQWDDKSGNGYDLEQLTSTRQPTTGARTMNSLNVLDFDATDDNLRVAFGVTLTQPNTIFAVFQPDTTTASYVHDGDGSTNRHALVPGTIYQLYAGTIVNGGSVSTVPQISRAVFDGASSSLHIDGSSVISADAGAQSLTGLTVGARYSNVAALDGGIAEIILVNGTLTAQQISDTETYLTNKWIPVPIQLNATAWFDASNSYSITESSGSVSQWDDLSGNGYHLTQGTGTAQPTTGTRTLNGLNVLDFDGTSDYLTGGDVLDVLSGGRTIIGVAKIDDDTKFNGLWGKSRANFSAGRYSTLYNTTNRFRSLWHDTAERFVSYDPGAGNRTNTYIISSIIERGDSNTLRMNGVQVGIDSTLSGTTSFDNTWPFLVGAYQDSAGSGILAGSYLDGFIGELLVFDDPAPADVATAESYLAEKWGVTLQEFSPADLSPTLWLDASDTGTITESGGSVSQWDDKSGNGNDVTQATGTDQPATGTRTLNGLNVLDFDGTNDRLWRSNVLTSAVDNITMILAYDADGVTGTRVPFTNGNGGNGYGISHTPDGLNYGWLQGGVAWKTSSTSATTGAQIVLFQIVSGTVSMRVNGAVVSGVQQATPTTPTAQFTIGSHVNSGGSAWDGGIAEAIFVDGTLTAQQIYDTENYLANKWGITLS